ncbi:MAG: ferrous iron transport protein B [Desulfobulbaceae bacterium]|nr:ferrous iron transport protein B [Desulfobulbaceae bacterium]
MNLEITMALAGNPNAGKTTLFNAITGSRQHVGNYPGVTVEKKEGYYELQGSKLKIVDLPGTYSLTAYSVEEEVARDFLVKEKPQVVINIVDASNLERNLYLTSQFFEMDLPMVIALNMVDVAKDRGIAIDEVRLSTLLGVPVVPIVARTGAGVDTLMQVALERAMSGQVRSMAAISYGEDIDAALLKMEERIAVGRFMTDTYLARWLSIKLLEGDQQIIDQGRIESPQRASELLEMVHNVSVHLQKTLETVPEAIIADHRYGFIKSIILQGVVTYKFDENRLYTSDKIDKVVTHRFFGPLIMVGVLMGLYHFTFTYSELPIAWVGKLFDLLAGVADQLLADGPLKSLVVSGIIHGVGGVLGFVPLIIFMFFGLAFLEDSGYLARVAFMLDRVFRVFGLHGNSVMAYIVSGGIAGGCAVPGVMATRTLRSHRERMATLLTAPFMNCGAKLPVLAMLIGTFFAKYQAQFMLFTTILAWVVALLVAKFLRLTILKGESTPFVMELPPYRFPTFKGLLIHTWEKTWRYIRKAGTVILGVSILLWVMMTYPGLPESRTGEFERERQLIMASALPEIVQAVVTQGESQSEAPLSVEAEELKARLDSVTRQEAELALEYSVAGRIGKGLEAVSWLPGFDWRTNIALIGGFAAKEVIVSTMATAYSLGAIEAESSGSLSRTLAVDPHWTPLLSLGLIVFIMFYSPCMVTLSCIIKEAGSWRWGVFSVLFNTGFAFILATLVYRVGSLMM